MHAFRERAELRVPLKYFDQVEPDQGHDGDSAVKVVEACCHCRPNNPGSQLRYFGDIAIIGIIIQIMKWVRTYWPLYTAPT